MRRGARLLRSVRVRITLAAVLVTAVGVAAGAWLLVRSVEDTQISQLRDDVEAQLDRVSDRLEAGDDPMDVVMAVTPPALVEVADEQGRTIAGPTMAVEGEGRRFTVQFEDRARAAAGAAEVGTDEGVRRAQPGRTAPDGGQPPRRDAMGMVVGDGYVASLEMVTRTVDTPDGTFTVSAAAPVEQVARSVDALRQGLVVGLPLLIALVAGVAWALVGRALRPVEAIRAEVDEITGTTMHRRVPEPPTDDEIGRLAHTMNAMLARLDATARRQRQFVSDASHELRSPVAAIRTGLEVACRKSGTSHWPAAADAALAEEARLESLLDDLLTLAALEENGSGRPDATRVDLVALMCAEAERPRRVPVEVAELPAGADRDGLVVDGVPAELARVASNLLDNAARHCRAAVRVAVERHGDRVRVVVDDDGPGIAPADRERVFERFARLDVGRARTQGGTGLGLAVVRSITTHHRGRTWVDDSPLGGARLVVELPAAAVPAGR